MDWGRETSAGVSVILPVFNAGATICRTVRALRAELQPIAPRLELIVVDDGSTDGTAAAVTALCEAESDVRLLRNRRNLGKGMSVYLGLLAARYAKACFTDADLPFSPGSYTRVMQPLLAGRPFAVASRRMPDSEILVRMEVLNYAARRHLVGVVFNHLVRALLRLPFRDTQCGLKAIERSLGIELLRCVRSPRFLFDIELFLAARHVGVPVDEVPVRIVYNDFKSSVRLAAESARMLGGLIMIWARERRGRYGVHNPAMAPDRACRWTEEVISGGAAAAAASSSAAAAGLRPASALAAQRGSGRR